MSDRVIAYDFPGPWPYEGVVVNREDPLGLGRVRVTIPGEIDESEWMMPIGNPKAGGSQKGALIVPPIGADVLLFFIGGDPENGRYLSGNFGEGEVPSGTAVTADGDCVVWLDERIKIELDARAATTGIRVTDRATGLGVKLDIDLALRTIGIDATLGLIITSRGTINIQGGAVTINGRPVAPGTSPI